MFRHPPRTQVYCIRPYCPEDQVRILLTVFSHSVWIFKILLALSDTAGSCFQGDGWREQSCSSAVATSLSVVRRQFSVCVLTFKIVYECFLWSPFSLLTGELCPSPESALVLEDDIGLCGYALALIDAKQVKTQVINCRFTGQSKR